MKNFTSLSLAVLASAGLVACGDNLERPDARVFDVNTADTNDGFPAAPQLGAQIDRMGRPAVNTALNSLLEPNATVKAAKKDAYNQAADPAMWGTTLLATGGNTILEEIAGHLGVLDVLDQGTTLPGAGCGNTVRYGTPSSANPYGFIATVLADDQLYLDTNKGMCDKYLSVEFNAALDVPYENCGGRTLTHDVIDTSYSLLSAGAGGFSQPALNPLVGDGVVAHTDVDNDVFPFLGAPH